MYLLIDYSLIIIKFSLDSVNVAKLLIDNKADVSAKDINGSTPLHYAAQNGWFRIFQIQKYISVNSFYLDIT